MQFIAKRVQETERELEGFYWPSPFPLPNRCCPHAQWFFLVQLTHAGNSQIQTEPNLPSLPVIPAPDKLIMNYHHKGAEATD